MRRVVGLAGILLFGYAAPLASAGVETAGGYKYVSAEHDILANRTVNLDVDCPGENRVFSGGMFTLDGGPGEIGYVGGKPIDDADARAVPDDGWRARVVNAANRKRSVEVRAVCSKLPTSYRTKDRDQGRQTTRRTRWCLVARVGRSLAAASSARTYTFVPFSAETSIPANSTVGGQQGCGGSLFGIGGGQVSNASFLGFGIRGTGAISGGYAYRYDNFEDEQISVNPVAICRRVAN